MRLPLLVLSIALCLLLASGCSKGTSRATAARVFSVNGKVLFGNADDFQPVTIQSRIHSGHTVQSSDDASIDLALIPAALAQLSADSEIKIEQLSITKDGNETASDVRDRTARIRLKRGKVIVLFTPSHQSPSQFDLATGQLTVKPDSDCLFSVWTDGKMTRVTCVKGSVNAFANAQPTTIAAGYFQEWPTTRTKSVPAAEEAAAQIDITESLKIEQRLQDEASAWQNRRPF